MSGSLLPKSRVYDDKGRVCIPKVIRDELGVGKGDKLEWNIEDGKITIDPLDEE